MGRRPILAALVTGALLIVLPLGFPALRDRVAVLAGAVTQPVSTWGAGVGRALSSWWPGRLSAENRRLTDTVRALEVQASQLSTQLQEVRDLAALNAALGERRIPTIPAHVLLRNPDPAIQSFTIDRGRADGIAEGSAVLTGEGVLVGRVRAVGERTAQVLLLTDPASRITVEIQNAAPPAGVLVGDRGTTALLSNVRRDSPIEATQPVTTSGIDRGVPRGIPVGTIGSVTTEPADLFQSATVRLAQPEGTPTVVAVVVGVAP